MWILQRIKKAFENESEKMAINKFIFCYESRNLDPKAPLVQKPIKFEKYSKEISLQIWNPFKYSKITIILENFSK